MRRLTLSIACLVLGSAAPALGASSFTIHGAGFGHGIGMSQYGADGFAQHGWTFDRILARYYTGTALGSVSTDTVVRVLLQSPSVATFSGATAAGSRHLNAGRTYRVVRSGAGRVALESASGRTLATSGGPLRVTGPGPLTLNGTAGNGVSNGSYRGWFEFRPGALGGVIVVNAVGIEQYVGGVVGAESPASWPLPALEAQAVAARTYAITTGHGGAFDQYPDTRSQVYLGVRAETASTNRATNGTHGQIVTYNGQPAVTYFFSTSGGRTENIEDSFVGAQPKPWLKSVGDPYDSVSPLHRWGPITMSLGSAGSRLGALVKGSFRGISVIQRGGSPRIVYADVVGSAGRTRVTGPTLKARFGLRDTWMTFNAASADVQGYDDGSGSPPPATTIPGSANGGTSPHTRAARTHGTRIAGRFWPGRRGAVVVLERRVGAIWRVVGGGRIARGGTYSIAAPGPGTYRAALGHVHAPVVRVGR